MALSREDLPLPFGPTRPIRSPWPIAKSKPVKTRSSPYRFSRERPTTTLMLIPSVVVWSEGEWMSLSPFPDTPYPSAGIPDPRPPTATMYFESRNNINFRSSYINRGTCTLSRRARMQARGFDPTRTSPSRSGLAMGGDGSIPKSETCRNMRTLPKQAPCR